MFTEEEIAYLGSQGLARLATVSETGQPDAVAVAYEFDGQHFWVGGPGDSVAKTRKFQNVRAGNHQVALVVDDLVSYDPFIARAMRIYGVAEEDTERSGWYLRITPTTTWSWNLAGEPVGETWYEANRTEH